MENLRLDLVEIDQLIADRRDIHRHPELAYAENRTARMVAGRLTEYGFDVKQSVGRTGVSGILAAATASDRTLLYRADMDALPIQEENDVDYRSESSGVMHACGHDAHVAIGLAVARRIAAEQGRLNGN